MRFKKLHPDDQDKIRLDVFIEEGRYDLLIRLFEKYKGRLMEIVVDYERAREVYIELCLANRHGVAYHFLRASGLPNDISDNIRKEYADRVKSHTSEQIPTPRDLQLLMGPL